MVLYFLLVTEKVFYKCFVCSDRWLIPSDFVLVSAEVSSSTQKLGLKGGQAYCVFKPRACWRNVKEVYTSV